MRFCAVFFCCGVRPGRAVGGARALGLTGAYATCNMHETTATTNDGGPVAVAAAVVELNYADSKNEKKKKTE